MKTVKCCKTVLLLNKYMRVQSQQTAYESYTITGMYTGSTVQWLHACYSIV
jgi:hypothetical protein